MKKYLLYFGNSLICLLVCFGAYHIGEKTLSYFNSSPVETEDEWIEALPDRYVSCEECMSHPGFMNARTPDSTLLLEALTYYNIQHPEIVYAQALLETGNFKSTVCRNYHNLFGLWNGRKKDYYKFTYWWESVLAYKLFIQSRYEPPNDYYAFLKEVGYAEDTIYIDKLKRIVRQTRHH